MSFSRDDPRSEHPTSGYCIGPGISLPDGEIRMRSGAVSLAKATAKSTGGVMSVFEITAAGGRPLHLHENEDECIYVLSGKLGVCIGKEMYDAVAGSFLFLPRRVPHRFWSNEPGTRLLLLTVP